MEGSGIAAFGNDSRPSPMRQMRIRFNMANKTPMWVEAVYRDERAGACGNLATDAPASAETPGSRGAAARLEQRRGSRSAVRCISPLCEGPKKLGRRRGPGARCRGPAPASVDRLKNIRMVDRRAPMSKRPEMDRRLREVARATAGRSRQIVGGSARIAPTTGESRGFRGGWYGGVRVGARADFGLKRQIAAMDSTSDGHARSRPPHTRLRMGHEPRPTHLFRATPRSHRDSPAALLLLGLF